MSVNNSASRYWLASALTFLAYFVCALLLLGPFAIAPATPSLVAVLVVSTLVLLLANAWCTGRLAWLLGRRWYVWAAVTLLLAPIGGLIGLGMLRPSTKVA